MYCGWSANDRIALAADDGIVAVYKSDLSRLRSKSSECDHLYGSIQTGLVIIEDECWWRRIFVDTLITSFENCRVEEEDYLSTEAIGEMNERLRNVTVGPSRLCPWRHFAPSKRKFCETLGSTGDAHAKNPRPLKRIVLKQSQQVNQSAPLPKPVSADRSTNQRPDQATIKAYFSPKPKS